MADESLRVVAYEHERHREALLTFIEKVLGPERRAQRGRIIDATESDMPGADRKPLRYVILDGERVAGSMGHLPADFVVQGQMVPARFTHDLLVDPDYRGRGLAKLIVSHAHDLGDFFPGGMWMTNPCYQIHLACGFEDAKPLTTYTLVLDPGVFVARKGVSALKRGVGRLGLAVTRTRALKRAGRMVDAGASSVSEVDGFDPGLDPTWQALAASYGVTRQRDAAYLNWRFKAHPSLSYRVLVASRDGQAVGYLVWRPAPEGADEKRAVIPDFLVSPGDSATLEFLLSRVIVDAAGSRAESISVLSTQEFALKLFRSFGFFPRASANTWVVAGWKPYLPADWLEDHSHWHMCLGDSDGDLWTGSQ